MSEDAGSFGRVGRAVRAGAGLCAAFGLAFLFVSLRVAPSRADERLTLSGSWTASALGESWSIGDWGDACGPKPQPQGAGGGGVQIREQGNELTFSGAGRAFSSAQCWEQMPGVSRTSHSASGNGRSWRTRCASAANDPRRTSITTTLSATDTSISMVETGQYQFDIHDTNCAASVTRSRTWTLVHRDGDTPPAASASATPLPAPVASVTPPPKSTPVAKAAPEPREPRAGKCSGGAGEPARLVVHPARKLVRAGDKFTFRAVVVDEDGCPTNARPTWTFAPGALTGKASVDGNGAVSIAADAGEGVLGVVATALGRGVTVTVEVASAEHFDALLAASGLNDAGENDEAAVAVIAAGTIGGRTGVAEDVARERKITFVAIVGGLSALLGVIGLGLARRGRGRAIDDSVEEDAPASVTEPDAAAAPVARKAKKPKGKICPTCGERYEAQAEFCGKDATKLVLLN